MPPISASVKATDTLTFSGVGYYRRYKNRVVDGNLTDIDECDVPPGPGLCIADDAGDPVIPVTDLNDVIIPEDVCRSRRGSIERLATTSDSWGGVVEGQEKARLFGRPNLFLAGISYDRGESNYKTSSEIGHSTTVRRYRLGGLARGVRTRGFEHILRRYRPVHFDGLVKNSVEFEIRSLWHVLRSRRCEPYRYCTGRTRLERCAHDFAFDAVRGLRRCEGQILTGAAT